MRLRSWLIPALLALTLPIYQAPVHAQEPASPPADVLHADGVPPHDGLDGVYRRFVRAYRELDSATMGALYTADALYLPAGGPMQRGREEVEAGFRSFFDHVRAGGATLAIGFEILDRQVAEALATDVGIYTLRRIGPGGEASPASRGKFTVVAVREDDGAWRFHVDSFSPLSEPEPADEGAGDPAPAESAEPPPAASAASAVDAGLEVRELRPGVWLHVSHHTFPNGTRFPSNGLAVANGDGLLLVDTAWGEVATAELLDRLEEVTGRPVRRAVSTHFHYDRTAGSDVLKARGVEVLAQPRTVPLASALGMPTPDAPVDALAEPGGHATVGPVELFYPGAGHSEDNLVVWVPEAQVLFGGCAVRDGATTSLGNTADADLASWPEAIRRVRERYPEAEVVVPGHGDPGGPELLDHTIEILKAVRP